MKLIRIKTSDANAAGQVYQSFGAIRVEADGGSDFKPVFSVSLDARSISLVELVAIKKDLDDAIKFSKTIKPAELKKQSEEFWASRKG